MGKIYLSIAILMCTGCATNTGDELMNMIELSSGSGTKTQFREVEVAISTLYERLEAPEERRVSVRQTRLTEIIENTGNVNSAYEYYKILLINGNVEIGFCNETIVIATGAIKIAHGEKNVLVSGSDIEISHDRGSIVIAKNSVDISHALSTAIYAPEMVKISFSTDVLLYNNENRKISQGQVNNLSVRPLFKEE